MLYGLVGENLVYSFSKLIHEQFGLYEYQLLSISPDKFDSFIANRQYNGLSITIPYKKAVMPHCDEVCEIAKSIGSVNTLYFKDGKLLGENTDYAGFSYIVQRAGICVQGKKVLIMGAGGTNLTVQKYMKDHGAGPVTVADREHDFSKDLDAQIIVNATPVGTFPGNGERIIDLQDFPDCQGVLDVIYNPFRTDILQRAKERGIPHSNGLPMLVAQAAAAATLFTGQNVDDRIEEVTLWLERKMQNIILIGMPGCGKSTIGKYVAKKMDRPFVDMDQLIEKQEEKLIPEIFEKHGETYFRHLETSVAKEIGKNHGQVIATGGGCVLRKENMDALTQNGIVFFLDRSIDLLEMNGRPLSIDTAALKHMLSERLPLYTAYSDYTISGDLDISQIAEQICILCV